MANMVEKPIWPGLARSEETIYPNMWLQEIS